MEKSAELKNKDAKVQRRHQRIWTFLWHVAPPFFKHMYSYSYDKAPEIDGSYLVLSNHVCELDPILVGFSFPRQMYFVASEHVYRKGFVSKLLFWAFEPIAKIKGSSDTLTVMKSIRKLRSGYNVCIFAEGNRSFDGRNSPISDATGKLVKTSGANLVTYKLEGGYLTNPRWGFGIRKGACHGGVVQVYTKEQLKEMSVDEVNAIIRRDLREDAYERQKMLPVAFKGKNRALGMECAYCVCPKCRSTGTISTKENSVFCTKCGNSTEFDEYGYFNDSFGVKNTEEWEDWQNECFKTFVSDFKDNSEPIFSDDGISMRTVDSNHNEENLGEGRMSIYLDRFEFSGLENGSYVVKKSLAINDIPDMSVYARNGFVFTDSDGVHYEITPNEKKSPLNVRKYISIWSIIRSDLKK